MKYFTFVDKDTFIYSRSKIWDTVLNVTAWPRLWKHVSSVQIHTQGEINSDSKVDCYFTLFHLLNLRFEIQISRLQKPSWLVNLMAWEIPYKSLKNLNTYISNTQ